MNKGRTNRFLNYKEKISLFNLRFESNVLIANRLSAINGNNKVQLFKKKGQVKYRWISEENQVNLKTNNEITEQP